MNTPAPRPTAGRCPGSLQLTMAVSQYQRPRCPVCNQRAEVINLDGVLVLVEHRSRSVEVLSMGMFA
jgi:hypothetical protein